MLERWIAIIEQEDAMLPVDLVISGMAISGSMISAAKYDRIAEHHQDFDLKGDTPPKATDASSNSTAYVHLQDVWASDLGGSLPGQQVWRCRADAVTAWAVDLKPRARSAK